MTWLAALSLVLVPHLGLAPPQPHDSVAARKLWWEALDQKALLNYDSSLALLQAARRADWTYFPAQFSYFLLRKERYEYPVLRGESVSLSRSSDPFSRCLGIAMAGLTQERSITTDLRSLERSGGATVCSAAFLAYDLPNGHEPDSVRLAVYRRAVKQAPEIGTLWLGYALLLASSHKSLEAEALVEQGQRAVSHPLERLALAVWAVQLRVMRADTAGVNALKLAIRAAMERDGRLGMRAAAIPVIDTTMCFRRASGDRSTRTDPRSRSAFEQARVPGDWPWIATVLLQCAHESSDHGQYRQALESIGQAIAIADSVRRPDLYLNLYIERGRANLRFGRLAEAERDLRRALDLGAGAGRLYMIADAHQQLAQMYESAARWPEANREAERFLALASRMMGTIRLSSLLVAGNIRWKSGSHAAASEAYEEMIRASDVLNVERYWSGEYYERMGDLQHARQYYTEALIEQATNSRAQSGLARVYEKLGQLDSAEAIARLHDSQEMYWQALELPLMPAILARQSKAADALRIVREWAKRQEARGNVQGAALAYLQVARFSLDTHSANEALVSATRAESLAMSVQLTSERVQAVMLRGRAQAHLGAHDSAVLTLRRAAILARDESTTDNLLETNLALGDAYAEHRQTDAALAAYDQAARAAERVTGSLLEDLDRARYRDRHLLPFDGAVNALLGADPGARRLGQLVAWSARRKAAALALATHIGAGTARTGITLPDIQHRLGEHDALLDYLVVDSGVAVIVMTREQATLVRLAISRDSLAVMVERLRHPLFAAIDGRLDLARAPFSLSTAAALHGALMQPLLPLLIGKRRLLIVPDGAVHALSFEALVVSTPPAKTTAPDYLNPTYLIDRYEVEYLPSSSFLHAESPRATSLGGTRLLVVAYGAPGGEREASAVSAAWPARSTTQLAGPAATERATKAAMSRYGVIHFVVHAQASVRDPFASHLRLVADSLDDGFLSLSEIAGVNLSARLVVLSACETDAGPIYNGEGVMGIARAFLASGAHAVVGTQWPVGPAMADLMGQFYRRLGKGEGPSPALRAAKLALRSQPETSHPFYWGAAVLVTGRGGR